MHAYLLQSAPHTLRTLIRTCFKQSDALELPYGWRIVMLHNLVVIIHNYETVLTVTMILLFLILDATSQTGSTRRMTFY